MNQTGLGLHSFCIGVTFARETLAYPVSMLLGICWALRGRLHYSQLPRRVHIEPKKEGWMHWFPW